MNLLSFRNGLQAMVARPNFVLVNLGPSQQKLIKGPASKTRLAVGMDLMVRSRLINPRVNDTLPPKSDTSLLDNSVSRDSHNLEC